MGGPSYQARRPKSKTEALELESTLISDDRDKCPSCHVGTLEVIDDMLLSCDECGFDVVIPKENPDEGQVST